MCIFNRPGTFVSCASYDHGYVELDVNEGAYDFIYRDAGPNSHGQRRS